VRLHLQINLIIFAESNERCDMRLCRRIVPCKPPHCVTEQNRSLLAVNINNTAHAGREHPSTFSICITHGSLLGGLLKAENYRPPFLVISVGRPIRPVFLLRLEDPHSGGIKRGGHIRYQIHRV
jgi:hypothetical protein